jgi:hypothetical protein
VPPLIAYPQRAAWRHPVPALGDTRGASFGDARSGAPGLVGSVRPELSQDHAGSGNMRSCIPIETSRPMRGARHCGLNASCCGVGAPKT